MKVELEITLRCNARCPSCERHCNIVDWGTTDMTLAQVRKFVKEAARGRPLELVSVMGGEPTLHPRFGRVLSILREGLLEKGKAHEIRIATNGKLPMPPEAEGLPTYVVTPAEKNHRCQLVAPADMGQEYRQCPIPFTCGISLTRFGYTPCGSGGAIARLFDLPFTRYQLPQSVAEFGDILPLCRLCQRGAADMMMVRDHGDIRSKSYRQHIRKHQAHPRQLRDY